MSKDPDFDSFFTAYKDDIIVNPSIEIRYDPGELNFACCLYYLLTILAYGRSIHATATIKPNELIVSVPSSKLINQKVLCDENTTGTEVTAQGALAKLLAIAANDSDHPHHLFTKILPRSFDSTPLTWITSKTPTSKQTNDLEILLKLPSLSTHIEKQKAQLLADYEALQPGVPLSQYVWAWLCVNSRCLYIPLTKNPLNNLTLAPVIDFLNHTDNTDCACIMTYNTAKGMTIRSTSSYAPGDEIYITYGPHCNEFLLCEYGFVLPTNSYDFIDISDAVPLSPYKLAQLDALGYKGEYTVSKVDGPSFRTIVALVAATLQPDWEDAEPPRLLKLLVEGVITEDRFLNVTTPLLANILIKKTDEWKVLAQRASDSSLKLLLENWVLIAKKYSL